MTFESDEIAAWLRTSAPHCAPTRILFGPERQWTEAARNEGPSIFSPRTPSPLYRIPTIIAAFEAIAPHHPAWSLNVATWGWPDNRLRDVGIGPYPDRVQPLPMLDRQRFQDEMLRSAAFCSVPETDAISATLLEGMASGSLPIVSDLPANREWIEDTVNGLVVPVGDTAALASAMRRAIEDTGLRESARIHNRSLIAGEATWEKAVTDMLGIYAAVQRKG